MHISSSTCLALLLHEVFGACAHISSLTCLALLFHEGTHGLRIHNARLGRRCLFMRGLMCFAQLLQVLQGVSWSADSIWLALFLHEGFPGPFHVTSLGRLLYEGTHGASISSDPTGLAPLLLEGPHGAYVHIPSLAWSLVLLHEVFHGACIHTSTSTWLALLLHEVFHGACVTYRALLVCCGCCSSGDSWTQHHSPSSALFVHEGSPVFCTVASWGLGVWPALSWLI